MQKLLIINLLFILGCAQPQGNVIEKENNTMFSTEKSTANMLYIVVANATSEEVKANIEQYNDENNLSTLRVSDYRLIVPGPRHMMIANFPSLEATTNYGEILIKEQIISLDSALSLTQYNQRVLLSKKQTWEDYKVFYHKHLSLDD